MNDVIGYIDCDDCGERATVHKTNRGKARYLYRRCGCGCDQRTGSAVQSRLFHETKWLGDAPAPPPNVNHLKVVDTVEEPVNEPEGEPDDKPKTTKKKPLLLVLAAGVAVSLLALMGRKS